MKTEENNRIINRNNCLCEAARYTSIRAKKKKFPKCIVTRILL